MSSLYILGIRLSEIKSLHSAHYFRLCDQFRRHREDFARVAPYAVADILRCFQDFPPPHPAVKANLLSAVR